MKLFLATAFFASACAVFVPVREMIFVRSRNLTFFTEASGWGVGEEDGSKREEGREEKKVVDL